MRWLDELSQYQLRIIYLPGEENIVADGLSRCVTFETNQRPSSVEFREFLRNLLGELDSNDDNGLNNRSLLYHKHYTMKIESAQDIAELCRKHYTIDDTWKPVIESLRKGENAKFKTLHFKNGLIYKEQDNELKLIVPNIPDVRDRILFEYHDQPQYGHPGIMRTESSIRKSYWWPKLRNTVKQYIKTCETCQRTKARQSKPPGLLRQHTIPEGRWEEVSMDFITNLPDTIDKGFSSIWTIVCRLTKRLHLILVKDTTKSEELVYLWFNNYVNLHGMPKTIICDRDSRFTSAIWSRMMSSNNIQVKMSCGYRSETAGQAERIHRFIEDYLRAYVGSQHRLWDRYMGIAEYAYNARYNRSIDMSPFIADLGYIPSLSNE